MACFTKELHSQRHKVGNPQKNTCNFVTVTCHFLSKGLGFLRWLSTNLSVFFFLHLSGCEYLLPGNNIQQFYNFGTKLVRLILSSLLVLVKSVALNSSQLCPRVASHNAGHQPGLRINRQLHQASLETEGPERLVTLQRPSISIFHLSFCSGMLVPYISQKLV